MDRLNQLRAALAAAQTRAQEALDAVLALADDSPADVVDAAEAEVTEAEAEALRCKTAVEKREALLRSREAHTPEPIAPVAAPAARGVVAKGQLREERTYRPDAGTSFFADMILAKQGNTAALDRLERNNREWDVEKRAGVNQTATSGGEFSPPLWLAEYAALLRAGRATVDAIGTMALPGQTNSINLPAITTGDTTAVQTDGGAVSNTDLVTAAKTAQVQTIAGRAVASYQIVDLSSPAIDGVIYQDLVASYNQSLDTAVINGSVTNAKGVLNVTGVNAVTYTSAAPKQTSATVADSFYNQVIFAKNGIDKGAFLPADFAVMHPSTWNWYLAGLDSSLRPLAFGLGVPGFNGTSQADLAAQGFAGVTNFGLPVVVDANVPVNLGAGTNQAPTILINRRGFDIWESSPVFKVADQTSITTLQYQLVLYGYYAVMSRQPKMISVINGTGSIVQAGY
jgi:HK97 family phage major capsid protein